MKKQKNDFSKKYDALFEKPKIRLLEEKKTRKLVLVGVIAVGLAAASPYLIGIVALNISERILNVSQKKLDELEESQPFTEVPIFKENLTVQYPPDYKKVEEYQLSLDGERLNFGNGYVLEMPGFTIVENNLPEYSLKPTERYDPVNILMMGTIERTQFSIVNDGKKHMYDTTDPNVTEEYTSVRVTGNLLESVGMQKNKEEGSFLPLYQQENIGDVKTGIVVNSKPSHGLSDELGVIPHSYVVLTKYWLFPDGVGVLVDVSDTYLSDLSEKGDFTQLTESKLAEIDQFTNNTYTWLTEHFKMTIAG